MFPVQLSRIDPAELSAYKDQTTSSDHEKSHGPILKTDAAIEEYIYHAFQKDVILRALEYDGIDIRVKGQVIYLYGHVVSVASQRRIINAMHTIPGILKIENNLVLDDRLIVEVSSALHRLEHTYACTFFTGASHGVISLNGIVNNENIKLLAEQCVAGSPNVRGVINNLRIAGTKSLLQNQPFLQPTIGELMYFLDGVSGVVKQVIMNPNNRRVIAMTIQGIFTEQRAESKSRTDENTQFPEQLVTVPIKMIRYLTPESGFLYITSQEKNQYVDFDPAGFIAPNADWIPPYPYCSDHILFPDTPANRIG
jgi:osmotically-inducible protein OsmY